MSELPDVVGGDIISAAYTNQVKERTVMRYASSAERDSLIPIPEAGSVAYLLAGQLTIYDGTGWRSFYNSEQQSMGPNGGEFTALNTWTTLQSLSLTEGNWIATTAATWARSNLGGPTLVEMRYVNPSGVGDVGIIRQTLQQGEQASMALHSVFPLSSPNTTVQVQAFCDEQSATMLYDSLFTSFRRVD